MPPLDKIIIAEAFAKGGDEEYVFLSPVKFYFLVRYCTKPKVTLC